MIRRPAELLPCWGQARWFLSGLDVGSRSQPAGELTIPTRGLGQTEKNFSFYKF